jgi:hypothetical protein
VKALFRASGYLTRQTTTKEEDEEEKEALKFHPPSPFFLIAIPPSSGLA